MPVILIEPYKTFTNVPSFGMRDFQKRKLRWSLISPNILKRATNRLRFGEYQDQSWPLWYRRLWLVASIVCFALCTYQIGDRVNFYLSYPYTTSVKVLRKQPITLPRFTFCSGLMESNLSLVKEILKGNDTKENICQVIKKSSRWNVHGGEEDVRRLWEVEYINKTLKYSIKFKSTNGKTSRVESEYSRTVYGNCLTLSVPDQVKGESGGYLFVERNLSRAREHNCFRLTRILVHQDRLSPRHKPMVTNEIKINNSAVRLVISRKEFRYLNHPSDPCTESEARNNCFLQCVHANLSAKVNCSLPYMYKSSLPACRTFPLAGATYYETTRVFKTVEWDDCHCARSCKQSFYQKNLYIDKMNNSQFEFLIEADNDLVELITEDHIYSLVSLLGDIGGNLGLYLGVCIMSLLNSLGKLLSRRK